MKNITHKPINKGKLTAYINKLKKEKKLFEYEGLIFDTKSLFETRYVCDPRLCLKFKDGQYYGSCCTDYAVDISVEEGNRIHEILMIGKKECVKKYPWVFREKLYRKDRRGEYFLKHRKNNTCALSVVKDGIIFCVLDILAKKHKLKRTVYKPHTCFSWPFDTINFGDKTFITFINSNNAKYLSQWTSCLKCVSGKEGKAAHIALAEQIKHYAGEKAHKALMKMGKVLQGNKP